MDRLQHASATLTTAESQSIGRFIVIAMYNLILSGVDQSFLPWGAYLVTMVIAYFGPHRLTPLVRLSH